MTTLPLPETHDEMVRAIHRYRRFFGHLHFVLSVLKTAEENQDHPNPSDRTAGVLRKFLTENGYPEPLIEQLNELRSWNPRRIESSE